MPEQRYEILSEKASSPPPSRKGFFSDFTVTNFTSRPVVLVDIYNKQHVVQPVSNVASANGLIELVYRSTDIPRIDPTQRYATVEQPIAATRIRLMSNQLDLGPVYVEELEVLVCLPEQSPAVVHPKSKSAYDYAVRKASVMMATNDIFPALRMFANDPSGLVSEIYGYMFGAIVRCPVTHLPNREANISIVITSSNQVVFQKTYPMGEFINKNKFLSDDKSPILCIGTSRFMVEEYAKRKERETGRLSEDDLKIIKAEAALEANKESNVKIQDLQEKLNKASWEASMANMKVNQLQLKIADQENQLSVCNSQINGYKAVFANHEQVAAMSRSSLQTDIVREKTRQAQIATTTEQIKQNEVVWKLFGGAAIAIVTAVVTAYLKDRK